MSTQAEDRDPTAGGAGDPGAQERVARAGLSRCIEPGDQVGAWSLQALGAPRLWELLQGSEPTAQEHTAFTTVADQAIGVDPESRRSARDPASRLLQTGLQRWIPRVGRGSPEQDLANAYRVRGGFVIPGDVLWPRTLGVLGDAEPLGLWWRGPGLAAWGAQPSLSVVGTRDPSPYGVHLTRQFAGQLASRGLCIVSGGAIGVDALAHGAALDAREAAHAETAQAETAALATVCVLAGGIDRLYPASNARLLKHLATQQLILSEYPPGSAPTRWRFLARNRLIAALSAGTLVVEGRWRSGSLSTAHHAAELGRWVGAVPGPITASTSEGPHRLIRDGSAELVTSSEEVLSALGLSSLGLSALGLSSLSLSAHASSGADAQGTLDLGAPGGDPRPGDGLDEIEGRLWESLPLSRSVEVNRLLGVAGVGAMEGLSALQRLRRKGLAEQREDGSWRRPR